MGRGVIGEVVWGNEDWYQLSGFKGQQCFGYESRQSMTTSDLLPGAPVGCRDVIVFIAVSDAAWPPLPSICITSIYFVPVLCAHKLLSFLGSALFTVCCSHPFTVGTEPSIHGPNMTVLCYNVRMRKREIGSVTEKAIRVTVKSQVWQRGQNGGQRNEEQISVYCRTFSSFSQLYYSWKELHTESVSHPSVICCKLYSFDMTCRGKRSSPWC